MDIKNFIRTIPDYPKPGIMFRDITTLFQDPVGINLAIESLFKRYQNSGIKKVVGIESRGFLVGAPLAIKLGAGFVPIRKKGKLPCETINQEYELEYGTDQIEIHIDSVSKLEKVLLVDDLIATGGTAEAAIKLLSRLEAEIVECAFLVDLPDIGGRNRLEKIGQKVFSLCEFEGD